jgi:hypothetical protein
MREFLFCFILLFQPKPLFDCLLNAFSYDTTNFNYQIEVYDGLTEHGTNRFILNREGLIVVITKIPENPGPIRKRSFIDANNLNRETMLKIERLLSENNGLMEFSQEYPSVADVDFSLPRRYVIREMNGVGVIEINDKNYRYNKRSKEELVLDSLMSCLNQLLPEGYEEFRLWERVK